MKRLNLKTCVITATLLCCSGAVARPLIHDGPIHAPAFIMLSEDRFDPAIQRLLASQELKVLPIENSQMFLIVPDRQDPLLEEMQIRYLEHLIDKIETGDTHKNQ